MLEVTLTVNGLLGGTSLLVYCMYELMFKLCLICSDINSVALCVCVCVCAQSEEGLLLETPGIAVSQLLHEVVSMVTEEGKDAIGYCVSFVASSTPGARSLHKTKLTEGMVHPKVKVFTFWL